MVTRWSSPSIRETGAERYDDVFLVPDRGKLEMIFPAIRGRRCFVRWKRQSKNDDMVVKSVVVAGQQVVVDWKRLVGVSTMTLMGDQLL